MSKCYLLGKNIKNSRSGEIYRELSEKDNIDFLYENADMNPEEIPKFVRFIKETGARGFNVTAPYKSEIIKYLDDMSEAVNALNAANTVINKNGKFVGYNTDVYGAKRAYENFLRDGKTLILGRGGAARALIYAFKDLDLTLYVRDSSQNDMLLKIKPDLNFIYDLKNCDFTNIINATSVGFNEERAIITKKFDSQKTAVDIIYTPERTLFLSEMENQGVEIKNGYDMLYYQAVEAYKLYKGEDND